MEEIRSDLEIQNLMERIIDVCLINEICELNKITLRNKVLKQLQMNGVQLTIPRFLKNLKAVQRKLLLTNPDFYSFIYGIEGLLVFDPTLIDTLLHEKEWIKKANNEELYDTMFRVFQEILPTVESVNSDVTYTIHLVTTFMKLDNDILFGLLNNDLLEENEEFYYNLINKHLKEYANDEIGQLKPHFNEPFDYPAWTTDLYSVISNDLMKNILSEDNKYLFEDNLYDYIMNLVYLDIISMIMSRLTDEYDSEETKKEAMDAVPKLALKIIDILVHTVTVSLVSVVFDYLSDNIESSKKDGTVFDFLLMISRINTIKCLL